MIFRSLTLFLNLYHMKTTTILFLISAVLISCTPKAGLEEANFLIGTWKITEGDELYERWDYTSENLFEGERYHLVDEEETRKDFLIIKKTNGKIVFEALNLSQSEGREILYTLNPKVKDKLSFENLEQELNTKIQYTKISENEILLEVLGKNGQGFSSKMMKVK